MLSIHKLGLAATTFLLCVTHAPAFDGEIKIDNAFVRIREAAEPPDSTSNIPASPTGRLLVSVGEGEVETTADGRTEREHWMPGHVLLIASGQPLAWRNVGPVAMKLIEIELKSATKGAHAARNPELDPITIDPKHNVLILENSQVRVFRSWREPGATEKMHEHAGIGRAAILLTSLDSTVKTADGSVVASRAAQGDLLWSGPVTHATTNLSSQRFEMIIVEVK